jgi:hypothetical protein
MTEKQFQPGEQHPEEWRQDLNPNAHTGQNNSRIGDHPATEAATAYEIKEIHRQFHGFTDDELKRIPVLPRGSRLEQGATYVDLQDPKLREIKATGNMEAGPNNWYVPKSDVDYQLRNRLIGITNLERLDTIHLIFRTKNQYFARTASV